MTHGKRYIKTQNNSYVDIEEVRGFSIYEDSPISFTIHVQTDCMRGELKSFETREAAQAFMDKLVIEITTGGNPCL